ncbi:hypothetical protein C0J52_25463 [Blattella germanica]|nr:hypothetical protein C0J52_25463 [Blattella germanica]
MLTQLQSLTYKHTVSNTATEKNCQIHIPASAHPEHISGTRFQDSSFILSQPSLRPPSLFF